MAKDKITEYDATAANNTVVGDVNLAENSALPSDMNNAVREVMSHLKAFSDGTDAIDALDVTGAATVGGNLLVGKTATGLSTTGFQALATGNQSAFISDGDRALILNRKTSDGDIQEFRKDGTAIGSIGVAASDNLYIAGQTGSTKGLYFNDGGVLPATTGGGTSDNAVDLGQSNVRFKDLYLSGGAYIGGTGSANKLEDYETGSWTPTLSGASTAGSITYQAQSGFYIKVGKIVHIDMRIIYTAFSGSAGTARISGLPYGVSGATNYAPISSNWITFSNTFDTAGFPVFYGVPGGTYFHGLVSKSGAAWVDWASSDFHLSGGTKYLNLTATYQTT